MAGQPEKNHASAQESGAARVCKKCLLSELSQQESFDSIYAYIRSLPAEQKAADAIYRERLIQCKNCDALVNGMCRLCGCFVEVRAVKKGQRCPQSPPRW